MKIAMIGSYGHVGVALAGLKEVPEAEVVAVAPWGPADGLGEVAKVLSPRGRRYDDWPTMLRQVKADVVCVFTPFAELAETATAAVHAGSHVFMEKPLATGLAGLGRLRLAVDRAGVELAACMAMRGEPAFRTIRKAVLAGRIGRPILASAQKSYPFGQRDEFYAARESYGGTIPWIGIHAIDFIHYCTGLDYVRVAAMAANAAHPSRPGMEDQGGILAELSGGGSAVIHFDYLRPWGRHQRPWGDDRLRIAGDKGVIETIDCASAVELTTPDATERLPLEPAEDFFAAFLRSLAGSSEPPITTAESFRMTEVALKARDAQDNGQFVEV